MKLGVVPFMNLKPLVGMYERGGQSGVELIQRPPSGLLSLLQNGEVEGSFLASVDYLRHRKSLILVPRFGVATRGRVASVLLLCDKPLEEVSRIVVDNRSVTSTAMLRVLLYHKFRLWPEVVEGDITQHPRVEALMVIGDNALQGKWDYPHVYDIGQEWTEWSGMPFIFGVFAVREEKQVKPVEDLLEKGWDWCSEHWEEIIEAESRRTGVPPDKVRSYLQENIRYELTTVEYEGLNYFGELLPAVEALDQEVKTRAQCKEG